MNSSRRLTVDHKHIRRNAKRAHQFKENQVLISSDPKSKTNRRKKNDERHVAIESAEFQLLVQLYVPANLLIKNNRVSMKQLNTYLPVLVGARFQEVNFELHILLSSLVTSYVSSWYCEKLNTDDISFVRDIYETLCYFVHDVCTRISDIASSPKLLVLINESAAILDGHLQDNFVENGVPKYARDIMERSFSNVLEKSDFESLKKTYLRESHVSFDPHWASRAGAENNSSSSYHQVYLRILIRNILRTVFTSPNCEAQGPDSSVILTNFLTILLADLVLTKTANKLSDPEFIISTVIGTLASKLNTHEKGSHMKGSKILPNAYMDKTRSCIWGAQRNLSLVFSAFSESSISSNQYPSVLFSPVVSLLNTISNFSNRKPVMTSVFKLLRSVVYSLGSFGRQIENITASYILERFHESAVTDDSALAQVIASLRSTLFEKSSGAQSGEPVANKKSMKEVTNDLYDGFNARARFGSPFNVSLESYTFKRESEDQMKNSIESVLRIFDSRESTGDMAESNRDINLLLVMKLVDCLVGFIYPEMGIDESDSNGEVD